MLARVKCWVEYNRVKTNPTNSQKHKNLHHCSSRLALHSLPPGDICEIDHWKHCRSIPPGGSLAPPSAIPEKEVQWHFTGISPGGS
ncbi:hypothetical protein DEO72_LG10g638 [Vigna unguiculata]|uniref:Uncharacterized protein n=1 Tax=Vigna unguiculata TaxID=3917 RepID=A0A4D6NA84_VIGUN|nr:hypothetical protein DEO72_LG10g638 [Vigna unguiculata]